MEIGQATEEDIDKILSLQTQIYRTDKIADGAREVLERQIRDETCDVFVVRDGQQILATAAIYYIQVAVRARPYAFLEGLVVDESLRGHGIGTEFFNKCVETARSKNCYKMIFTS